MLPWLGITAGNTWLPGPQSLHSQQPARCEVSVRAAFHNVRRNVESVEDVQPGCSAINPAQPGVGGQSLCPPPPW